MLVLIYQYNIKPVKMLEGTILGQVAFAKGSALEGVEAYKKALIYNTGLDRDSRASFVRSVLSRQNLLYALDKKEAKEIVDYAISLAELNLAYNPQDSLMQMQLAQVLSIAVNFAHNKNGMISYLERAHKAIDESIKSSPGRIRLYYVKAQLHLTTGDIDSALKVLNYAVSLNKDYYDSYCHLSRVYANTGSIQESYATADKCVDLGGASLLQGSFVKQLIEHYSATSSIENNTQRLISLFERLSKLEQRNAQVFINLAQLYAKENNNKQAIKAAEKAAAIDVSLRSSVDRFVNTLKAKE